MTKSSMIWSSFVRDYQILNQRMQMFQNGGTPPSQITSTQQQNNSGSNRVYSEDEIALMAGDAPLLEQAVNFEKKRDGFTINERRYFDPEGEISGFAANSLTGEVTYIAKTGGGISNTFSIKYIKVQPQGAPITIAKGTIGNNYIKLETSSGISITGEDGVNTSKGFVIRRKETAFLYTIGKGITNFFAPEGFHVAEFQFGDIESTGYILLERNKVASSHNANPLMGLMESANSLGSSLGITEKKDYALKDIHSGKIIELNISYDKAAAGNPLFMENGQRRYSHYYWRICWFKGLRGTYALYHPNGSKMKALELNTGNEVTLFDSIVGSVGWESKYSAGNRLKIKEIKQRGTGEPEVIDDFENFFHQSLVASAVTGE